MPRILVTGGTGAVGPSVVHALADAGHRVRLLARGDVPRALGAKVAEVQRGDVTSADDCTAAVGGMDVVVHLAALLHLTDPAAVARADYDRVNVHATRALAEAARRAGVKRFVLASTIAVYGEAPVGLATETTPLRPETPYARSKAAAEGVLSDVFAGPGERVVVRLGAVYGPAMKGNYRELVRALARGRFVAPGAGRNRRSIVFAADAAAAMALAAVHPAACNRTFNVADPEPYPLHEIIEAISAALGRRPPAGHVPRRLALAAAAGAEWLAPLAGRRPPLTREMVRKFNGEVAVDAGAIAAALGWRPRHDLREGWAETVAAMREAGDLARGNSIHNPVD